MHTTTTRRGLAVLGAAVLTLAACGGSDDADDAATDEPAEAPADEPADADDADGDAPADEPATGDADDAPADEPADDGSSEDGSEGGGTFEPGSVSFRSVNLLDRPVDIYVRTTGLVEAFPIESGVAPGAVTEYAAPPEDGRYIVTEAGAGDPTCVSGCDHFIAEASASFGEGPTRTVLLYDDPFSGPTSFDLSEEPDSAESAATSANLLDPADPTTGLVIPIGITLDEDVFGFRLGYEEVVGCVDNLNASNILVGGNQTNAYAYPGDSAGVLFFEQPDQDCETPVADAVTVSGGPGTRTLVILQGAPPTLEFTVVELSGSVAPDPDAGADAATDDESTDEDAATDDEAGAGDVPADREEFVEAILSDAPPGIDEQCVADLVAQFSDDDFQVLVDSFDDPEIPVELLSPDGLALLEGIVGCAG